MSGIGPRNMGHGLDVAALRFADGVAAPPQSPDPVLYRKALQLFLRDTSGIQFPLAVGADGIGVVVLTAADSPYTIQDTDRILLVDTTAGPVTAKLPASGGPYLGRPVLAVDARRSFGVNPFTLDGNGRNIGASPTLVLATPGASTEVVWTSPAWEVASGAGASARPGSHAPTHLAGGSDDLLSEPGPIGGAIPDTVSATELILPVQADPNPLGGHAQVYSSSGDDLVVMDSLGGKTALENGSGTATAHVRRVQLSVSIPSGGSFDLPTAGSGGYAVLSVWGTSPSFSASALVGVGSDGTTAFNGPSYTNVTVALGTANKFNVGKSAPNTVRFENNLTVTANLTAEVVLGAT